MRQIKYESILRTRLEYDQRIALDRIAARRGERLSTVVRSWLDLLILNEVLDERELAAAIEAEAERQKAHRAELLQVANEEIERRATLKGKAATRT